MKATNLITCTADGATITSYLDSHVATPCLIYAVFYYSPLLNVCDFKGTVSRDGFVDMHGQFKA
jgi:hypothetical protein